MADTRVSTRPVEGVSPVAAKAPGETFINGIGGLRALAVLSVVLFHVDAAWLPGGFVGVDVFFVISGFVVAHSVSHVRKDSFREYFLWFYRRRFLRILPAIYLYVLVVAAIGIVLLPITEATYYLETTGIAAMFGASNFALLWKAGDYFAASSEYNTFTHTWSLAVEEQYYLLFPVFSYVLIVRKWNTPAVRRWGLRAVWLACLLSLACAAYATEHWRAFAFYMLPTRLWELGIGFLLRVQGEGLARRLPAARGGPMAVLSALALGLLALSFVVTPADRFPFPGALLPCLATLALIAIVWLQPGGWVDRLLQVRVLQFFGTISYSLYLWHWGVVVLMRWTIGLDTLSLQLLALALMLALSATSYYTFEKPLRYSPRLLALETPGFFATYAVAGSAIAVACLALLHEKPHIGLAASNDPVVWSPYFTPNDPPGTCAVAESKTPVGAGIRIDFTPKCAGAAPGAARLFVIGDSHAGAYQRLTHRIAASERTEARLYWLGSCHLLPLDDDDEPSSCSAFREAALAQVLTDARPGDVLFLPGLTVPLYRNLWDARIAANAGLRDPATVERPEQFAAAEATLARIRARGLSVILEAPKPTLPAALFRCADWYNRDSGYCRAGTEVSRADMEARRAAPLAALRKVAAAEPGVTIWDPTPLLCDPARCTGYRDGKPLYFDAHHLSGYANDLLYPDFRATFDRVRAAPLQGENHRNG